MTVSKWDKVASRLEAIDGHVRDAEAAIQYKEGQDDNRKLEADVLMLLATVRKAYAGALDSPVQGRGSVNQRGRRGHMGRGGGRGRGRGGIGGAGTGGPAVRLRDRLVMIERMLWEAKYSSVFSKSAALAWRNELLGYLQQRQRRMEYTALFGHLTNEWAEFRFGELSAAKELEKSEAVAVGRKEMYEQRQTWERHVTNERRTDTDKIANFLDDLFHSGPRYEDKLVGEPTDLRAILLRNLRREFFSSCRNKMQVTTSTVRDAIRGVLSADQLTSEKRRAMLDISDKVNVLSEIADILNIDTNLESIKRWSWGENPITVQMRKAINGKYHVHLDLELLDAILIECIGQYVSLNIGSVLQKAWSPEVRDVWMQPSDEGRNAAMQAQIEDYGSRKSGNSVCDLRHRIYQNAFFAAQLPTYTGDVGNSYDPCSRPIDNGPRFTDLVNGAPNRTTLRGNILNLCSAEMAIQKLVHGQFCILQSDFEWFGPSQPHSTLLAIMKYFHFPGELVHFVEAFLSMRMRFEEDGSNGPVLTRRTGTPISFQLTYGISELMLFTLDFAVNQRTEGTHLYRNHDDLWFWGQPEKCVVAWDTICQFSDIMGLRLNKRKTASAHSIDKSNPRYAAVAQSTLDRLPSGEVKWGFLQYDPSEWKWAANKSAIEEHMKELRYQLSSRTSVMAHIQAYNAYMESFLANNFGRVVNGLGDFHAITVLEALQYAQQCLYGGDESSGVQDASETANVAKHVRKMIQDQFALQRQYDLPDCFLYMGVESGGLGLANPVPAFAKYVDIVKEEDTDEEYMPPMAKHFEVMRRQLSDAYRVDCRLFGERLHAESEKNKLGKQLVAAPISGGKAESTDKVVDVPTFMSFSDYVSTSEEHSSALGDWYKSMFDPPILRLGSTQPSTNDWAAAYFESELKEKFGGSIAEEEFLSLGLYRTLAEEKVRWQS